MAFGGEGGLHASKVCTYCSCLAMGLVAASIFSTQAATLNIQPNWNLLGYSDGAAVNVADVFSNTTDVTTVWKWIPSTSKWAFYSPSFADGGAAYAASKGYDPLLTINYGDGFWVNAKTSFTATILSTCTAPQVLTNGVCAKPVIYHANGFSSVVVNQIMTVPVVYPVQAPIAGSSSVDPNGHYGRYNNMGYNATAHGDMFNNGLDNVIVTPNSSPAFYPNSKMEFWVNNGDGTFTNKADQLIVGGAPSPALGPTIVADFNGDGILDIVHMDSPEWGPCTADIQITCNSGGQFTYLESQTNGTWIDKSNQFPATINTDSGVSMGSSNGDGVVDILFSAHGLHFYKNDGSGHFTEQTSRFPPEIRGYGPGTEQWNATGGMAQSGFGAAAFLKVAGQSKPVLVNASYGPDWEGHGPDGTEHSTIRFFLQQGDGSFINTQTIIMSKDITNNCGANIVRVGDFANTGNDDVLVVWEQVSGINNQICHPMLYRNIGANGSINYSDVTNSAISQWQLAFNYASSFGTISANEFTIADADGDGNLDILIGTSRYNDESMLQRAPFLYGDGKGSFTIKPVEFDNIVPTGEAINTAMDAPSINWHWDSYVLPMRLKSNQRYGMLLISEGWFDDQTVTPYIVSKQIRLHSFLPSY